MFTELQKNIILAVGRHSGVTLPELIRGVGEGVIRKELKKDLQDLQEIGIITQGAGRRFRVDKKKLRFYFSIKYELYARNPQ